MKWYRLVLVVSALAIAVPAAADARDTSKDKAAKSDKADKTNKEKSEKDKSEKDRSDKDTSDKADKDKAVPTGDAAGDGTADPAAQDPAPAAAPAAAQDEKDDAVLDPAQPDFTVIALPTTLRLPKYKSAFRVTHRFARPLGDGSLGSLADDFFGLDASAQIGLEFRFGIFPGAQIGINRTSDKTIQFFGQYDVKSQSDAFPLGIAAYATIEGTNNLHDDDDLGVVASYSPSIGVVLSRSISRYAAVYVMPTWVNNTNQLPSELAEDNSTFLIGIGGRVRVHGSTYVVAEVIPRASGFDPGVNQISFGVEKRVGGHSFQLNFSNAIGTTMAQIARGGLRDANDKQDWFLGFNISRKFF